MAQQKTAKEIFNFRRGLITEVNPFLFPEDAATDLENVEIDRKGVIKRRLGMDYQANNTEVTEQAGGATTTDDWMPSSFLWRNASNTGEDLFIVHWGGYLHAFDATNGSVGAEQDNIVLTASDEFLDYHVSFAVFGDVLNCTIDGAAMGHTPTTTVFPHKQFRWNGTVLSDVTADVGFNSVYVRDIWGIDDDLDVDEEPTSLTNNHNYNLQNQGWTSTQITGYEVGSGAANTYPSNAQIMHIGRNGTAFPEVYPADTDFYNHLQDANFGTTPAPKGRVIIDLTNMDNDRDTFLGVNVDGDNDFQAPTSTAAFAGRAWYGFNISNRLSQTKDELQPQLQDIIAFSQVIKGVVDIRKCYQEADPTSEYDPALVDSDGGTVSIPGMGGCLGLVPFGRHLIVFGNGGVWSIAGAADGVFSAASFEVPKISDAVLSGKTTIVRAPFAIAFWTEDGIYVVRQGDRGGLQVENIVEDTIQTAYDEIGSDNKRYATGTFQAIDRKFRWLYTDRDVSSSNYARYNKELVFDLRLGAWTRNTFSEISGNSSAYVCGYIPEYKPSTNTKQIYLLCVVSGGVSTQNNFTFGELRDDTFVDFETEGVGQDYTSYIETGNYFEGDSQRTKQIPYLTMHFNRIEQNIEGSDPNFTYDVEGSCLVTSKWDFSDSTASGQESGPKEFYRLRRQVAVDAAGAFDYGQSIITTKDNLRGSGRCLRLRFESSAGKDFQIVGWGLTMHGQTDA